MAFEYDYHVHTTLSYCHEGDLTVDNLIKVARERGLKGFAIADHSAHIYFDRPVVSTHEYILNYDVFLKAIENESFKFEQYLNMLAGYKDSNVLTSTEVDVAVNGRLIFDPKYRGLMDVLPGGIHWLPCMAGKYDSKTFLTQFMDFTMMLLDSDIDILVHPTRIFRRSKMEVPHEVARPIITFAKQKGIAIEVNSHTQRDPDPYFVRMCIDEGVKLAMGTDTHNIAEIGDFTHHKALFKELGISDDELDSLIFKHDGFSRNNIKH
jgi:histidinol phosphatase-like PHP family hydrolase